MTSILRFLLPGALLAVITASLVSCADTSVRAGRATGAYMEATPAKSLRSGESRASAEAVSSQVKSRPGLATTVGGETYSSLADATFFRNQTGRPQATDVFHYNDEEGAKAMAAASGGGSKKSGLLSLAGGRLEGGLKTYGDTLPHFKSADRRIVAGQAGRPYEIYLENDTKKRLEVVVSVDGLDVMDGKAASAQKRGLVIPPDSHASIQGFRSGATTVRQFVFGSVADSAAARAGAARNVGVVGLAVYEEDEAQARAHQLAEAARRTQATAFPGLAR